MLNTQTVSLTAMIITPSGWHLTTSNEYWIYLYSTSHLNTFAECCIWSLTQINRCLHTRYQTYGLCRIIYAMNSTTPHAARWNREIVCFSHHSDSRRKSVIDCVALVRKSYAGIAAWCDDPMPPTHEGLLFSTLNIGPWSGQHLSRSSAR